MDISRLKGPRRLWSNGAYMAAAYKKLSVYSGNGEHLLFQKDYDYVLDLAFLPNRKLLVLSNRKIELLSLPDGTSLWNTLRPQYHSSPSSLRLCPTKDFVFWLDDKYNKHYLVRVNLASGELQCCKIKEVLRSTCDLVCDSGGKLVHILQTQRTETEAGAISEHCILRADFEEDFSRPRFTVVLRWQYDSTQRCGSFMKTPAALLRDDLSICLPAHNDSFSLVENCPSFQIPFGYPQILHDSPTSRYLQIVYIGEALGIIMDKAEHRIVAQYVLPDRLPGCLVGDEYWLCSQQGLIRKPFPLWEQRPPQKLTPMFTTPPQGTPI